MLKWIGNVINSYFREYNVIQAYAFRTHAYVTQTLWDEGVTRYPLFEFPWRPSDEFCYPAFPCQLSWQQPVLSLKAKIENENVDSHFMLDINIIVIIVIIIIIKIIWLHNFVVMSG